MSGRAGEGFKGHIVAREQPNPLHRITASVVTYKTDPDLLDKILVSLCGSEGLQHLMVVDNSPDDRLRSRTESAGAEYFHPGHNLGFGAGHNHALKKYCGSSRYHVLVNPDITCESSVLADLYQFMEHHSDVGLVMPRIVYPDGREQRLCKRLPTPVDLVLRRFLGPCGKLFADRFDRYELRHLDLSISREIPCLSGCFMFIRSSALQQVGFFDERFFMYMEDVDLCRRIGSRFKTVFYPEVSVTHNYAKGSYRSLKLLKRHMLSAIRYFGKWGWIHDSQRDNLNLRTSPLETRLNLLEVSDPPPAEPLVQSVHGGASCSSNMPDLEKPNTSSKWAKAERNECT